MAETFPSTLQELLNETGFSYEMAETAIRSKMDIGPAKVRRRFSNPIDKISCTITMDLDDFNTLYVFYNTTLNGGVGTFLYDHPFTGSSTEFRFTGAPTITPMGGRNFRVNFNWEEVP